MSLLDLDFNGAAAIEVACKTATNYINQDEPRFRMVFEFIGFLNDNEDELLCNLPEDYMNWHMATLSTRSEIYSKTISACKLEDIFEKHLCVFVNPKLKYKNIGAKFSHMETSAETLKNVMTTLNYITNKEINK